MPAVQALQARLDVAAGDARAAAVMELSELLFAFDDHVAGGGALGTARVRAFAQAAALLAAQPEEARKAMRATVPGGEFGRPEDVAAAAVWLCSPEARWVNGQNLVVDGGGVLR